MKAETSGNEELSDLFRRALNYDRAGDLYMAIKLYKKLIRLAPEWSRPYRRLGSIYKDRAEWKPSFYYNSCATERNPKDLKAWQNLAIAATALKKWKEARTAWNQLGFDFRETNRALDLDLGAIAICLHSGPTSEVVWGRRIDPARAIIESVPHPDSGYGYGDLVLVDNVVVGHLVRQGKKIPVFDELQRIKKGDYQTFSVMLHTSQLADIDLLAGLCRQEAIGFDNWSMASRHLPAPVYRGRMEFHPLRRKRPQMVMWSDWRPAAEGNFYRFFAIGRSSPCSRLANSNGIPELGQAFTRNLRFAAHDTERIFFNLHLKILAMIPRSPFFEQMKAVFVRLLCGWLLLSQANVAWAQAADNPYLRNVGEGVLQLTEEGAIHFSGLALSCLQREYPNKLNQVLPDAGMLKPPRELHPAFYGCFDWHSSVHGHWMLVRLLKEFPGLPNDSLIRQAIGQNLQPANIDAEVAYFQQASKSWERMYGWAWLLKLAEELHSWDDPDGRRWYENLRPLTEAIVGRYQEFLPVQQYPVRTGVHPNTAFGLAFAWDYAQAAKLDSFQALIEERSVAYFGNDRNCPASWEPSGEDFLSACLEEADLMRRVLPAEDFSEWWNGFLPADQLAALLSPADVSDRSDPKIVHLDGLNLSRAWCMYGLLDALPDRALRTQLLDAARAHLLATLPNIASEHYEGTHWLASFAVYALSLVRSR